MGFITSLTLCIWMAFSTGFPSISSAVIHLYAAKKLIGVNKLNCGLCNNFNYYEMLIEHSP
jgi:hypothetical protein